MGVAGASGPLYKGPVDKGRGLATYSQPLKWLNEEPMERCDWPRGHIKGT